ncbi:MAG TPA: CHAP domain-containing protein, partial [Pirellulales bacterium]
CLAARGARADFVELGRLLDEPAAKLAKAVEGKSVAVAVRRRAAAAAEWDLGQAAGVELTEALRRRKIDAVRAAADSRLSSLEAVERSFKPRDAQTAKRAGRDVLIGIEWIAARRPSLKISALPANSSKALWTSTLELPAAAQSLANNLPPMNRAVVEYARQNLGQSVRDGDCTHLAEECLKAAGTGKRGVYQWGRELDEREPWLPGDIVQMERVEVKAPGFQRTFGHHTAVIEEADLETIVVLHQNAFPEGKNVQRESWPRAGITGVMAAYRPWDWPAESPLPPASPSRVAPRLVVRASGKNSPPPVDLLKLIDPELDRVQGLWFFEKSNLRTPCEFAARMQVPVKPPPAYAVSMKLERLQGQECLGLGVLVGGRQTMLEVDGYQQQFSGIHNLDGKPANENESKKSGIFLPLHKQVELECRVTANSILLQIDRAPVIDWQGDARRLSLSPDWPVPHRDWLFLAAFDSEFDIRELKLTPLR